MGLTSLYLGPCARADLATRVDQPRWEFARGRQSWASRSASLVLLARLVALPAVSARASLGHFLRTVERAGDGGTDCDLINGAGDEAARACLDQHLENDRPFFVVVVSWGTSEQDDELP